MERKLRLCGCGGGGASLGCTMISNRRASNHTTCPGELQRRRIPHTYFLLTVLISQQRHEHLFLRRTLEQHWLQRNQPSLVRQTSSYSITYLNRHDVVAMYYEWDVFCAWGWSPPSASPGWCLWCPSHFYTRKIKLIPVTK